MHQPPPLNPATLLTYLRLTLNPAAPLLDRLPAILDVYAIFQQLSNALIDEATRALDIHAEILTDIRRRGLADQLLVRYGGLNKGKGEIVDRVKKRWRDKAQASKQRDKGEDKGKEGEGMDLALFWSLALRRCHIAMLIADPSCPLTDIASIIDSYFPLDPTDPSLPIYCRVVRKDQQEQVMEMRDVVLDWLGEVSNSGAERPSLLDLTQRQDGGLPIIIRNIISEAERVLVDWQDMHDLFPPIITVKDEPVAESPVTSEQKRRVSFRSPVRPVFGSIEDPGRSSQPVVKAEPGERIKLTSTNDSLLPKASPSSLKPDKRRISNGGLSVLAKRRRKL